MKKTFVTLTLLMAICVAVLFSLLFQGCYSTRNEAVCVYRWCELKSIDRVELGYNIYWKDASVQLWYEPIFATDTTGLNLHVGMQAWVPLKR